MTTKMVLQQTSNATLTTRIVDKIAEHKGVDPADPDFCLYEDTDPEALERLLAGTDGPLTTNFRIDDTCVTVERNADGETAVEVESVRKPPTPATE